MARPWIGENYGAGLLADLRLLILGESNYSPDPIGTADEEIVASTMHRVLAGEKFGFFNKLSRLIVNGGETWLTQDESVAFWQSVAFHNFVPVIAANAYGQRPPAALWTGGAPDLFLDTVENLRPEAILVCGADTWHHLPQGLPTARTYRSRDQDWPVKEYHTGADQRAVALPILHPSSHGWTYERNVPIVKQLSKLVASTRATYGRKPPPPLPLRRR